MEGQVWACQSVPEPHPHPYRLPNYEKTHQLRLLRRSYYVIYEDRWLAVSCQGYDALEGVT